MTNPHPDHPRPGLHLVKATPTPPAALPEVVDYGPILPPWLRSQAHLKAQSQASARRWWWRTRWHAFQSPFYTGRLLWRATRGTARTVAYTYRLVAATEYVPLTKDAVQGRKWADAVTHHKTRWQEVRKRLTIAAWIVAASGLTLRMAYLLVGPWVLWAAGGAALVAAVAAGRPDEPEPILGTPDLPTRVDLAPDHLNDAFRAAGLIRGEAALVLCAPILRDRQGNGWEAVLDLPRGGGKTAADALAKRDVIAAELGVDEIQVIMGRVRASAGGHAGRLTLWVADDDPYLGEPTPSPLVRAESWSIWDRLPYGRDARGTRTSLDLMWQSMFFGGLPRRGKTAAQRLISAAGVLDPHVKHYVADGKGGSDWIPMRAVAHRLVLGAEDDAQDALVAMLHEVIREMEKAFKVIRDLPPAICPDSKLTPQISRRYGLPVTMVTVDELQEYLTAMDKDAREKTIDLLCRIARRGPAAGFILNVASQRPDTDSVPARLRDIVTYRYCTQVTDKTSSDMVLGKGKATSGADASVLHEDHKGVGVLVTGPASFTTVKCDYIDAPTFTAICARGRELRIEAGTLTGDAAGDALAEADAAGITVPLILSDCLDVMHHTDRIFTVDLLAGLVRLDEDTYHAYDADRLADELDRAGVVRTGKQVKIAGENRNGYRRADLEGALPVTAIEPRDPRE